MCTDLWIKDSIKDFLYVKFSPQSVEQLIILDQIDSFGYDAASSLN